MATNLVQLAQPVATDDVLTELQNAFNGREQLHTLLTNLADQRKELGKSFLKTFAADLTAIKGDPDKGFVDAQFIKFNAWKIIDEDMAKRIDALRAIADGLDNQITEFKKGYKKIFIDFLTLQIYALKEQQQKQEYEEDQLNDRIEALEKELIDISSIDATYKAAPTAKNVKGK